MPIEIGLLPTQQDSFEHHEELSKLLHETDVRQKRKNTDHRWLLRHNLGFFDLVFL